MNEDGKEVYMSEVRRIWMNHYVKNLNRMEVCTYMGVYREM